MAGSPPFIRSKSAPPVDRPASEHPAVGQTHPCLAVLGVDPGALLNAVPMGILVMDAEGRVCFMNAYLEMLTGARADRMMGLPCA